MNSKVSFRVTQKLGYSVFKEHETDLEPDFETCCETLPTIPNQLRPPLPKVGGGKRVRTADPLLAKQVLYQLSYTPVQAFPVVGLGRFELPTSRLSGVRSNQLSYRP